jgi:transposase
MNSAEIIASYENKILAKEAEFTQQILFYQSELATYRQRCEQYSQAYDQLRHQLNELIRHRFGKKSERFIDTENRQLSLFGNDETALAEDKKEEEENAGEQTAVAAPARHKSQKNKKDLPRRIEIIPVAEADKHCACGACKTVIRYEIKESLDYQPAVFAILEQRREVVACPKGCDGAIITAPAPPHVLPKVKATEELLSFLVVSKLDDRQPLYHLEKQLNFRYGIDCSRQTMARWLIDLMAPLQPIYNLLKDEAIAYDVASCDATTLQVLKESGRAAETKSYVYCIRGGPPEKSVILYGYNDRQHLSFVKDWFEGFSGYLHVDGDSFFNGVGDTASLVNCNAHARRKFEPIAQSAKNYGLAKEALRFFKALYKIEREAKNRRLTPEQRHQLRQEKSRPLMEQFNAWLDNASLTVLPQSPLGKAITYCIKLRQGLMRFLEDGRLEIDNNLTEQEIKPLVIARKNFMFCTSVAGAKALCMHLGFIRTAKAHGLDPYHYYVKLLKSISHCKTAEDYEQLLPWNIKRDDVRAG